MFLSFPLTPHLQSTYFSRSGDIANNQVIHIQHHLSQSTYYCYTTNMVLPHESFFFLTGGTGPRPTRAAFLAAAAKRTAKTEVRREHERSKEKIREQQMQREKSLKELDGVGVGVTRLLGLRGVGEKGARKGRGNEGKHADTGGKASSGHGQDKTFAGESLKDVHNAKEPGKDTAEDYIAQSAGYSDGALPTGKADAAAHSSAKHTHCNDASAESGIQLSIDKNSDTQEKGVEMLLDADPAIAATPKLPDGNKLKGEKGITADGRENFVSNGTHNSPSQRGQSMHESIYSHVPNTQPVLRGLGIDSDINPDDIRPPILTPAPDPDDNVEWGCDRGSDVLPLVPKSASPDLESDINPDNIRPPTLVPDPDDNLDRSHHNESAPMPTHLQNTVPGFESDINPDDIRPPHHRPSTRS